MQQVSVFTEILPSLYRLDEKAVYAYLPDERNFAEVQKSAVEILHGGGTFIYLRHSIEEHAELLMLFADKSAVRPTVLFLDNEGDYPRHWKTWSLHLKDGKLQHTEIIFLYGFRIVVAEGSGAAADEEGIRFADVRFGRNATELCRDAVFSWDGRFRFLVHAGGRFLREAQIRYELDGYDEFTKRYLSVVCRTDAPRWDTSKQGDNVIWAQADLWWESGRKRTFTFLRDTEVTITGFPPVNMENLVFRFARGTEDYYLAPYGSGSFLEDADVKMGEKGTCSIRQNTRMAISIEPEGYLGESGASAEVSMLKIYAPIFAAGIELETKASVPILPAHECVGKRETELMLNRKLREDSRPAYHRDVCLNADKFQMCVSGRETVWFNLWGQDQSIPGVALCHVDEKLAQAVTADSFFIVLDGHNQQLFDVPYTINEDRLNRAVQAGYPKEEGERLLRVYPKDRIFLGESMFRREVENAQCTYAESLKEACHHFEVYVQGEYFAFLPETWTDNGTILVVKKGTAVSVAELADDVDAWSFLPGQPQITQSLLREVCGKAQGMVWAEAFQEAAWEGSIVISGRDEPDERIRMLILKAGENTAISDSV